MCSCTPTDPADELLAHAKVAHRTAADLLIRTESVSRHRSFAATEERGESPCSFDSVVVPTAVIPHGSLFPRVARAMLDRMSEIVFQVVQEADGGFVAECLSEDIFTQGDSWDELRANVREAVLAYFFDQALPPAARLHLVRDELLVMG